MRTVAPGDPVVVSLILTPGAEPLPGDCLPPPDRTDQALRVRTSRAGLVQAVLAGGQPPAPLQASLLGQGGSCQAAVQGCFDLAAGVTTPLYAPGDSEEEHAFLLHLDQAEPWIASGAALEIRQEAP